MQKYLSVLLQTALFTGFSRQEILSVLNALHPAFSSHKKQDILMMPGYRNQKIGIVLRGEVEGLRQVAGTADFTMMRLGPGGLFGEILALSGAESPVTVQAASSCDIMLLAYPFLFAVSSVQMQQLHLRIQQNLAEEIARKYFMLDRRIALLLIRSLRQRIATYLLDMHKLYGNHFALPFNRAGFARHLGCERSALCRELSRMGKDGLLRAEKKNIFLTDIIRLQATAHPADLAL